MMLSRYSREDSVYVVSHVEAETGREGLMGAARRLS